MISNNKKFPDIYLALAFIVSLVACQAMLVVNYHINWDEFYYLSQVYDAKRSSLGSALQTLHVHLFGWLIAWPDNEIDKIIAGRWVMLFAELITIGCIVHAAKTFVDLPFAVFAVLTWLTAGFTLTQGFSFRVDPIATSLLMGAISLSLTRKINMLIAAFAGVMVGLAGLITIKSVLYAPVFLGVFLWQLKQQGLRAILKPFVIAVVLMAATFLIMYYFHSESISEDSVVKQRSSADVIMSSLRTTLLETQAFPQINWVLAWLVLSIVPVFLMIVGAFRNRLAWLFIAPLLSLVIYRNSFPYFFPFIAAPAMIAVAIGAERFLGRRWIFAVFGIVMVTSVLFQLAYAIPANQKVQQLLVSGVHQIFPEPVPYIDQSSMIASFPKQGFFMTTWGMLNYRQTNQPVMNDILTQHRPPLLIANNPVLLHAMGVGSVEKGRQYLLAEDNAILKSTYVHYWGPVYVAGFDVQTNAQTQQIEIKIPGEYRNDSRISVSINESTYKPGETVNLDVGSYHVKTDEDTRARFVWAETMARPKEPFPDIPVFKGF